MIDDRPIENVIAEAMDEPETLEALLFERWYRGLLDAALAARLRQGITQDEVAIAMGTRQPSIARLERDDEGGVSARRLWSYLRACGLIPMADTVDAATVIGTMREDHTTPLLASALVPKPTAPERSVTEMATKDLQLVEFGRAAGGAD